MVGSRFSKKKSHITETGKFALILQLSHHHHHSTLSFPADRNIANFRFRNRPLQKGNKKNLLGLILLFLHCACPVLPLLPLLCFLPQTITRETLDCFSCLLHWSASVFPSSSVSPSSWVIRPAGRDLVISHRSN